MVRFSYFLLLGGLGGGDGGVPPFSDLIASARWSESASSVAVAVAASLARAIPVAQPSQRPLLEPVAHDQAAALPRELWQKFGQQARGIGCRNCSGMYPAQRATGVGNLNCEFCSRRPSRLARNHCSGRLARGRFPAGFAPVRLPPHRQHADTVDLHRQRMKPAMRHHRAGQGFERGGQIAIGSPDTFEQVFAEALLGECHVPPNQRPSNE